MENYRTKKQTKSRRIEKIISKEVSVEAVKPIDNCPPSIDFLTNYNSKINITTSPLNFQNTSIYQTGLTGAVAGIQNILSSFNKFESTLPNIAKISAVSQAFDLSRNIAQTIANLSTPAVASDFASQISKDYSTRYNGTIVKNSLLTSAAYSALGILKSNQSLIETMGMNGPSSLGIQSSIAKAMKLSFFAEKSLSTFPWSDIGNKIGLNDISKGLVGNSFLGLSKDYSELLKSYSAKPSSFLVVSPSISKLIPIEYYTGANFLEVISSEEEVTAAEENLKKEIQYENEYSLNLYLPKINIGLLNMWKGAVETYNSNNSDKVRQFTVSMRELFGHLIRTLAPDDKIKKWTSDVTCFYEGRPTRKARLQYICRNISSDPFTKFVDKDIQATIEFIAIFQDGTHSIESKFTPYHLVAIKSKAESTLKFLLEIEFSTNK